MRIKTAVADLFGIEDPIVLAPTDGTAGGALAAATGGDTLRKTEFDHAPAGEIVARILDEAAARLRAGAAQALAG